MNSLNNRISELLAADTGERDVAPVYLKDGDCLVFYASDVPCHAHRIDGLVTVYYSDDEPRKIVGCQIKDIGKMLKRYGPFGVEIGKSPHQLGFYFLAAGVIPESSPAAKELYESEVASQTVDLHELCGAGQ